MTELMKVDSAQPLAVQQQENKGMQVFTSMLSMAIEKDFDIVKLEKIMRLHDEQQQKIAVTMFNAALAKAQSEFPVVSKTDEVDFTSANGRRTYYKFSSIGSIVREIKKPLSENGFSYRFEQTSNNGMITVKCILMHSGGHSESDEISAPIDSSGSIKNPIQQAKSTRTYLKRATLEAVTGVVTAEDDDDGQGYDQGYQQADTGYQQQPQSNYYTQEEFDEFFPKWKAVLSDPSKGKTPQDILNQVAAGGRVLTPEQVKSIQSLGGK